MSYKRIRDARSYSLAARILEEGDKIPGVLVVFAIQDGIRLFPVSAGDMVHWCEFIGFSATWNHLAYEDAFLKAYLFALVISQWASPHSDVTWITDRDAFVANDDRLDDSHKLAARVTSMYLRQPMGIFAMNTTEIDGPGLEYEDLLAIPDIAAGMIADLLGHLIALPSWANVHTHKLVDTDLLKAKVGPIVGWFWDNSSALKKVCVVFDRADSKMRVFKLDELSGSLA